MKIYTKKEEFCKRYNLNKTTIPVTGKGYRMDYYTDECGITYQAFLENQNGWWYATEFHTGLRINTCGFKTRKECAAYVEENGEKLSHKVLDFIKEHKSVYLLGPAMTEEEFFRAVRAAKVTDNNTAEAEPEPADVVETAEPAEQNEQKEVEPAEQNDSEPADVSYYRFIGDFATCQTLEALKNTYLIEYGRHKDEKNIIAELTRAWGKHFDDVKCLHVNKSGKIYSTEARSKHEEVSEFPMLVELVAGLGDISISIEGTWTWITGNTKPHKEELKALGFRWSPKRRAWCKLPAEKCA